jgi:putative mRNA 3-end processing factor
MRVRGTRRRRAVDRGFVLSDHADWEGLLGAIRATGAERVGVTHGYIQPLVRWLREREKVDAFIVPTRYEGERTEDAPGSASDEGPPGEEEPDGPGAEGGEP